MQSGIAIVARALATYVAWIVIGVGGAALLTGGKTSLDELVSHRIGLQFVVSCLFLVATIRFAGWPVLGFVRPQHEGWWKLFWLPAANIAVFVVLAVKQGLPSGSTWVAHVLFVLPSFVFALFLPRRIPQNVITQDK